MIWLLLHRADESWLYFHVVRTLSNVKIETPKKYNSNKSLLFFQSFIFCEFFHFSNFLRNKTRILRFLSAGQSVYWTGKSKFSKIEIKIFSNFWLIRISVITMISNAEDNDDDEEPMDVWEKVICLLNLALINCTFSIFIQF